MTYTTLVLIAIGLSMDALAASISKGLAMPSFRYKPALLIALCFGVFQGIMPLIGYGIGVQFNHLITHWDHWIAFILLSLIGLNMLREGLQNETETLPQTDGFKQIKSLLTLSIATSIDALAVGVSFAFLEVNIYTAAVNIALCTFILTLIGVKSGHFLGKKFKSKAEIFGAIILIGIGIKILFEHNVFRF